MLNINGSYKDTIVVQPKRKYERAPCSCSPIVNMCPACKLWNKKNRERKVKVITIEIIDVRIAKAEVKVSEAVGSSDKKNRRRWLKLLQNAREKLLVHSV